MVRLVSNGPKYRTKEGYLRDQREHDADQFGIEYEVELVEFDNEVARLFLKDTTVLQGFKVGDVVAIGWKRTKGMACDGMEWPFITNVAWRVEDCTHLSSS